MCNRTTLIASVKFFKNLKISELMEIKGSGGQVNE